MATYNERITAGAMTKHTMEGDISVTGSSVTINGSCSRSGQGYGTGYAEALTWVPDFSGSSYKSTKRLKTQSLPALYVRSKTLNGSGQLYSGSYEALYGSGGGQYVYMSSFLEAREKRLSQLSAGYINEASPVAVVEYGSTGQLYSNVNVSVNASITFDGPAGTNKPYVDVTWEDIVPVVSGMAPSSGAFVDETQAKTFNWTVGNVTAYDGTSVLGTSVFKWRANGITHSINANPTSVTVPAGTFPNGAVEWCVVHTTTDGISNVENWQTFTTVETTPEAPSNLSPRNEVVNGNEATIFSWHHNISTGSAQKKADLQYSTNGSTWTALATVTGSAQSTNVSANVLPAGELQWRVRTYNTDDTAGPWETASIIVKARPTAPSIDQITGVPLAKVTWSASNQAGYRVVFSDSDGHTYDSGERYGNVNSFRSPVLLSEGEATCTVYVANSSGLWNSTTISFSISNDASGTITLDGNPNNGKAILSWASTTTGGVYYVLKNGEPIAQSYTNIYEDKTANGVEIYEVICLFDDGTYVRSDAITLTTVLMGAQVFDFGNDGELLDLYVRRENIFEITKSKTAATAYYTFSGQTFPTAYTEYTENETISFTITKENNDCEAIYGLLGALCCVKDKSGSVVYGVLDSVSVNADRYSDLTLSFTRVEREGVVAYE